tara:strand:- start:237 stop:1073 length:837 start_codon:yes stop_codon:yes gene_type:complete
MNYITKFVTSENQLHHVIKQYSLKKVTSILDYVLEHNDNVEHIKEYVKKKITLFQQFPLTVHSLKLSSIGLNYGHYEELMFEAQKNGCVCLIDAEDYYIQDTINFQTNMMVMNNKNRVAQIFKTYQMYRNDSMEHLLEDIEMFNTVGLTHNIKLVRGAYLIGDRKHGIIHDTKEETDTNYNNAVKMLTTIAHTNPNMNVIFATHNKTSIDMFKHIHKPNMHHAVLMGMDKHFHFNDPEYQMNRMVHIPFGPIHKTYPYMLRRLLENNPVLHKFSAKCL